MRTDKLQASQHDDTMSFGLMVMGLSYGLGLLCTSYGALYGGAKYVTAGVAAMAFAFLLLASA